MRIPVIVRSTLVLVVALALLSACATDNRVEVCPQVNFVDGLQRMTAFGPAVGADLSNVAYSAQMVQLAAVCSFGRRGATVTAEFLLIADRGPADRERVARLDYFVAVADVEGEILAKEIFHSEIPFADNRRRVGRKEEIEPFMPSRSGDRDFTGYRVLIGFQLSPEQVEFNRIHRQ